MASLKQVETKLRQLAKNLCIRITTAKLKDDCDGSIAILYYRNDVRTSPIRISKSIIKNTKQVVFTLAHEFGHAISFSLYDSKYGKKIKGLDFDIEEDAWNVGRSLLQSCDIQNKYLAQYDLEAKKDLNLIKQRGINPKRQRNRAFTGTRK